MVRKTAVGNPDDGQQKPIKVSSQALTPEQLTKEMLSLKQAMTLMIGEVNRTSSIMSNLMVELHQKRQQDDGQGQNGHGSGGETAMFLAQRMIDTTPDQIPELTYLPPGVIMPFSLMEAFRYLGVPLKDRPMRADGSPMTVLDIFRDSYCRHRRSLERTGGTHLDHAVTLTDTQLMGATEDAMLGGAGGPGDV